MKTHLVLRERVLDTRGHNWTSMQPGHASIAQRRVCYGVCPCNVEPGPPRGSSAS